jgi:energy-coupling factor transport system substrate-specific component
MDLQFWPWALGTGTQLSYQPGGAIVENVSTFFQYHFISALAWDLPRAIITVSLIGVAGPAALNALRRARTKAAFVTQIEFAELADSRFNHR